MKIQNEIYDNLLFQLLNKYIHVVFKLDIIRSAYINIKIIDCCEINFQISFKN